MIRKAGYALYVHLLIVLALFGVFAYLGTSINRKTEAQLFDLFINEQILQLKVAKQSIQERIRRLINESTVLSVYSFPEYQDDIRTRGSIENLLTVELDSYEDVACYSYYDFMGDRAVHKADETDIGRNALLTARVWENMFREHKEDYKGFPIIPNIISNADYIFLGFLYPIVIEDTLEGLLTVVVDLKQPFDYYLNPTFTSYTGIPMVIDEEQWVIWSSCPSLLGLPVHSVFPAGNGGFKDLVGRFFQEKEGFQTLAGMNDGHQVSNRAFMWTTLEVLEQSMKISMLTDESRITDLLHFHRNQRLFMYLGLVLLLVFLFFWILRSKLIFVEKEMLQENNDAMSRIVEENTGRLRDLHQAYSNLFHNVNDAILLFRRGRVMDCNKKALVLYDGKREDLIGCTIEEMIKVLGPSEHMSVGSKRYLQEMECRTLKDRTFFADISLSAIDVTGDTVLHAVIRDVTERVEAFKEKEAMLREIHHRVKNNLQILDSIFNLQIAVVKSDDARSVIMSARRRIDVMAKLHEMRYLQEYIAVVDLSRFLQEVIGYFNIAQGKQTGIFIESRMTRVFIEPTTCMYIGLIVSELIDNAVTHGCSKADKGKVTVILRKNAGKVVVKIHDNGLGFNGVEGKSGVGLGLDLISTLMFQLQGDISWNNDNGTEVTCVLPF